MAMIVMGLFDDAQEAQEALRALEIGGFRREDIDVRTGDKLIEQMRPESGEARAGSGRSGDSDGIWARIRHFVQDIGRSFKRSSSREQSSERAPATAPERDARDLSESDVLIIVNAAEDQAKRAADIMEEHGASDEVAGVANVRLYSIVMEEVAAVPAVDETGQPGIALLSPEEERDLAASEREFQRNWQAKNAGATGLTSDQILPGYEYGYRLGRTPMYSKTEWSAIEPQVKRDWDERRYGPWDRLKEVVRSGWDRAHRH